MCTKLPARSSQPEVLVLRTHIMGCSLTNDTSWQVVKPSPAPRPQGISRQPQNQSTVWRPTETPRCTLSSPALLAADWDAHLKTIKTMMRDLPKTHLRMCIFTLKRCNTGTWCSLSLPLPRGTKRGLCIPITYPTPKLTKWNQSGNERYWEEYSVSLHPEQNQHNCVLWTQTSSHFLLPSRKENQLCALLFCCKHADVICNGRVPELHDWK